MRPRRPGRSSRSWRAGSWTPQECSMWRRFWTSTSGSLSKTTNWSPRTSTRSRASPVSWSGKLDERSQVELGHALDEQRAGVEVACRRALAVNVAIYPTHLIGSERHGGGDLGGGHTVVLAPEAQVHLVVGEGEVKLVLPLGK